MKVWESVCMSTKENAYLRDVYGIPDHVSNVENWFRVKHGFFSWTVINLSDFPDADLGVVFCKSPLFRLLETDWCLQLCPKAKVNGQRGISLRLMREGNDSGPEKVLTSYRLGLRKSTNNVWFEARESTFWKGNFIQLNTSVLGYLDDFFIDGMDEATVVCEIYVSYFMMASNETGCEVSEIDESLTADMSALLASNHSKNALIEIRGHQVWAHKSILSVRSKTLGKILKDDSFRRSAYSNTPAKLQLSCSFLCLKCVLLYMYTGSFDYLARNAYFSIGLYEIADELSLLPLRDLFYPDKMSSRSRIHIYSIDQVYHTQFNIRSFFLNTTFKIQPKLHGKSDQKVSISIWKIGHISNFLAAFKLEISGLGGDSFHAETSLSILNIDSKCVPARFLSQKFDESGSKLTANFVLSAAEFLSCDVLSYFIAVKVAFRIHQMRHDHVRCFSLDLPRSLEPWCWRKRLAQDLKTLLHCGYANDASMFVGGRLFGVHRPILAARSVYFHSLFHYDSSGVYILEDLSPRIFWLMLNYVYSGTLSHFSDLKLKDFNELGGVAFRYTLPSLLKISYILQCIVTGKSKLIRS